MTETHHRPGQARRPDSSGTRRISLVIPAYNEEEFLPATLEHLAAARREMPPGLELEVIVSDDGSGDRTRELARALADRVVVPAAGDRTGPGAARNRGAAAASGELLVFIDADGRLQDPPRFLARAWQAFADDPKLAAATCRLAVEPELATRAECWLHRLQDVVIYLENRLGIHTAGGWCQVVPRRLFERVGGYNQDLVVSQDVDLFLKLGRQGKTRLLWDLRVFESPRRYRQQGLLRTYLARLRNSVAVTLGRRSRSRGYRPSRPRRH